MITPQPIFSQRWHWPALITCHLLAFALLASYMIPAGHELWRSVGATVFLKFNGSLAGHESWALFWAWMNTREVDALVGVLMLSFLVFPVMIARRNLQSALTGFVALMIILLPTRALLSLVIRALGYDGHSPSMMIEPAYMLSDMFPHISAKDHSSNSFPGDHASVLFVWCGLVLATRRKLQGSLTVVALSFYLVLPRLISGAHWLADVVVGAGVMTLITLSWAYASPAAHHLNNGIFKLCSPIFKLLGRIPGLNALPFFRG